MTTPQLLNSIVFYFVFAGWFIFALTFILQKRTTKAAEEKRNNMAALGVAIEAMGYAIIWIFRRPYDTPIISLGLVAESALALITATVCVVSVWMVISAVRTLGKQWAVAARIVEGHQLITDGVYAKVRNPIYSGMLGMLIATGLAASQWYALLIAMVIFWIGTIIRVRVEEQLLRETFGTQFDDYAQRVPALFPKIF